MSLLSSFVKETFTGVPQDTHIAARKHNTGYFFITGTFWSDIKKYK